MPEESTFVWLHVCLLRIFHNCADMGQSTVTIYHPQLWSNFAGLGRRLEQTSQFKYRVSHKINIVILLTTFQFGCMEFGAFWSERSACAALGFRHKRIGLSGVPALPLAAGINVVAIVLGVIFLSLFSLSESLTFLPEGIVVGFCNFAWAPK